MSAVRAVAGFLLVALVPGYLLLQVAFPRGLPTGRRPGSARSLTLLLSVVLSVAVSTLVGLLLGFLPSSGRGYFQGAVTGLPLLESALVALCLVLGLLAYVRGAFPRLAGFVGWTPPWPPSSGSTPPSRRASIGRLVDLRRGETDLTLRILVLQLRTLFPQGEADRRRRRRTIGRLRNARDDLRGEAEAVEEELARARFGGSP